MNLLNTSEWLSKPRLVCGVMTGTSLDGIDIAIGKFSIQAEQHKMEIIDFATFPIDNDLKSKLKKIINNEIKISEVSSINFQLSMLYNQKIRELSDLRNIKIEEIDAISIHGQTVWHDPDGIVPNTLQIASGSALSKLLGKVVISDFRSADVALRGQGAPLVPIFDFNFFRSTNNRVLLNIGGMSNLTYLPAGAEESDVIAFDSGPGNVWIDGAMKYLFDLEFDENGFVASKGEIIPEFLAELKKIEYIKQKPPKSTGRELFNYDLMIKYIDKFSNYNNRNDIISTLTFFTAWSISYNLLEYCKLTDELIISGGGFMNKHLIELLSNELRGISIRSTDYFGIPSDAKEALCFAYLGWRTLGGLHSNIPSVTGATEKTILGSISF